MDTQGFTNPVHVLGAEGEQDAQGEPDEQQESDDLTETGASED